MLTGQFYIVEYSCLVYDFFQVSKATFAYILEAIRPGIAKDDLVGYTIPPETRLAVCLLRLGRGMYFYPIAEMFGIGETTAQNIYNETIRVITDNLFSRHVTALLPHNAADIEALQNHMDFPFAFGAIDGCHLRLQCPIGETARKDYYNFKHFYSIILMGIVDGTGRFLWACAGMPGNCHDSTLLQSTSIWSRLKTLCEISTQRIGELDVPGMILADNAFPFRPYIMKRFSQARTTPEQQRFNKRHASSRVIIENTFGMLKMRFRELFRGSESQPNNLKYGALAAVTIHNIMLAQGERVFVDNPEREAEGLTFLEPQLVPQNHNLAIAVRDSILPLVL